MACPALCTAEKCAELEARIGALEQALELLEAAFEAHTQQPIPTAHNYQPNITVNTVLDGDVLISEITIDGQQSFGQVKLPNLKTFVTFDIFQISDNQFEFVSSVNGDRDSDILDLSNLQNDNQFVDVTVGITANNEIGVTVQLDNQTATDYAKLPDYDVAVGVFDVGNSCAAFTVQVGDSRDEDIFCFADLNDSETDNHIPSNLSLSGSFRNDTLTLTVADGESQDSTQITIDIDNSSGGGGGSLSCENLSNELQDCCGQLLAAINANYGAILNNYQKIQDVENYLTIDVSSTVFSDYECEFVEDEDEQIIPNYAEAKLTEKSFSGVGIEGINERLKYLAQNQDAIYTELCKAVPPPISLPLDQTLQQICADNRLLTQADFETEQGFFDYITGEIQELLTDSILSALIKRLKFIPQAGAASAIVTTTLPWAIGWLVEQMRGEQKQSTAVICEGISEPQDVVTLVASEKELHRVDGKQLILAMVTLDNYPKRKRDSSWRPIQIPAPRESYDWITDFKDLRWQQGNQYAELVLEGYKHGVSGWFEDQAAADSFFDAVLNLTTATEVNRLYPKHKNPKTAYTVRPSRPWRAYVSQVKTDGGAETLITYFPDPNEET